MEKALWISALKLNFGYKNKKYWENQLLPVNSDLKYWFSGYDNS